MNSLMFYVNCMISIFFGILTHTDSPLLQSYFFCCLFSSICRSASAQILSGMPLRRPHCSSVTPAPPFFLLLRSTLAAIKAKACQYTRGAAGTKIVASASGQSERARGGRMAATHLSNTGTTCSKHASATSSMRNPGTSRPRVGWLK